MSQTEGLTFSQREGYVELPDALQLEELPKEARTQIWNVLYEHLKGSRSSGGTHFKVGGHWEAIVRDLYLARNEPLDEWRNVFSSQCLEMRKYIEEMPFNDVFDRVEFIMRRPTCPATFVKEMETAFAKCRLAYMIDRGPPPTIFPATMPEEGDRLRVNLNELRAAGLQGCTKHLRDASKCLNDGDWAGSVRESIHAVEAVTKKITPKGSKKPLSDALKILKGKGVLNHGALIDALDTLYGYTSDEHGIRHALLEREADVTIDEAVFMLGACASFASYLWRKHKAAGNTP